MQATSWFKSLYHQKNSKTIEIKEFSNFGDSDTIYIVLDRSHFYVLVYLAEKNIGYIANGANDFIRSDETKAILQDRLKIELRPTEVEIYNKINCCGAEAALIALKLGRFYSQNTPGTQGQPYLGTGAFPHFETTRVQRPPISLSGHLGPLCRCGYIV